MAVQKSKVSRRRRGNRRGHDSLKKLTLSKCNETSVGHIRHHINAEGYYRGEQILTVEEADDSEE